MAEPARATTTPVTPVPTPALVPQKHGGALRRGGNHGNRGGKGHLPSALRAVLRGTFAQRVPIIEEIADGKPVQRTRVLLADILPHVSCPNCGEAVEATDAKAASVLEIVAVVSASSRDRLGALDLAAKYGLGALKEVSVENVRERVLGTLNVIRQQCEAEQANRIIDALRPLWA